MNPLTPLIRPLTPSIRLLTTIRHYTTPPPPPPLTPAQKTRIARMLRVDHAGEIGANWIYKGQLAVLGGRKDVGPVIEEMWKQEIKHLNTFNTLLSQNRVRPSALQPFWEVAGYALGVGTALLGKEAAMACTEAVETVIGEHYNDQIRELMPHTDPEIAKLRNIIKEFRDDELEHKSTAIEYDSKRAPLYEGLNMAIQQGCRMAIWVAKRV